MKIDLELDIRYCKCPQCGTYLILAYCIDLGQFCAVCEACHTYVPQSKWSEQVQERISKKAQ